METREYHKHRFVSGVHTPYLCVATYEATALLRSGQGRVELLTPILYQRRGATTCPTLRAAWRGGKRGEGGSKILSAVSAVKRSSRIARLLCCCLPSSLDRGSAGVGQRARLPTRSTGRSSVSLSACRAGFQTARDVDFGLEFTLIFTTCIPNLLNGPRNYDGHRPALCPQR